MTPFARWTTAAPGAALGVGLLLLAGLACDRRPPNEPASEAFSFPTALHAHAYPGGQNLLFVLSSNFDLGVNGGSMGTVDIDLAEELGPLCAGAGGAGGVCGAPTPQGTPRIRSEAVMNGLDAVRVASFARDFTMSADRLDLYVPSGGDDSLTWIDVHPENALPGARTDGHGALVCDAGDEYENLIAANCLLACDTGDLDDEDLKTWAVPGCNERHRPNPSLAEKYAEADEATLAGLGFDPAPLANLPAAPFSIVLSADGTLAHVTHLDSGALSVFRLRDDDDGRPEYLASFDSVDFSNGIDVHPPTGLVYVTGRSPATAPSGTRIAIFETAALAVDPLPFEAPEAAADGSEPPPAIDPLVASVSLTIEASHDLRGLVFSPDGQRAFAVERGGGGDVLLFIDTSGAATGDFHMAPQAVVPVGSGAQNVLLLAGAGDTGGNLILVSCFKDNTIYIVDEDLREVSRIVDVDTGPFGIATFTPDGATAPTRIFVASFTAGTVTALDARPGPGLGDPLYVIGTPKVSE